jgi:hypothetical protein
MSRVKHCEYLLNILKMLYPELREDSSKTYYMWCNDYLVVVIDSIYFRIYYSMKRKNKVSIIMFTEPHSKDSIKGIFHNMFRISRDYSYKDKYGRHVYILYLPKEELK